MSVITGILITSVWAARKVPSAVCFRRARQCRSLLLAPALGAHLSPDPPLNLGFAITPMKQGAYIDLLQPGSAAERSGLKPGMVISHVNGVALAGLGEAMQRLLEAAEGEVSLRTVSGGSYVLAATAAAPTPAPAQAAGQ